MTAVASDTWANGDRYERYVGRWSRLAARPFLRWLAAAPQQVWLDVGCGTGALVGAILESERPRQVFGVEPSEGFLSIAHESLRGSGAVLMRGDAAHIPLPDGAVDVAVSGLVLNFVPDLDRALAQILRAVRPQGTVGAYVWDYAEGMELIRHFWDAAVALDPQAHLLDEAVRFPLCQPVALAAAFTDAQLHDVEVASLHIQTPFRDFDDYWTPFLGGQGPAPSYVASLSDKARDMLRDSLRERLPRQPDGSILLSARVWAVKGVRRG